MPIHQSNDLQDKPVRLRFGAEGLKMRGSSLPTVLWVRPSTVRSIRTDGNVVRIDFFATAAGTEKVIDIDCECIKDAHNTADKLANTLWPN